MFWNEKRSPFDNIREDCDRSPHTDIIENNEIIKDVKNKKEFDKIIDLDKEDVSKKMESQGYRENKIGYYGHTGIKKDNKG